MLRGGYGMFWAPWNYSAGHLDRLLADDDADPEQQRCRSRRSTIRFRAAAAADRQHARARVGREQRHQLLRSGRHRAAHSAVFGRTCSASSAGNMSLGIGYVGSRRRSPQLQQRDQHQSAAGRVPLARPDADDPRAQPVLRRAGAGTLATQATVQLNSLLVPYPQYGLKRSR